MALTLSNRAIIEVARIIAEQNLGDVMLRVSVKGGGCSGFSYSLGFTDEAPSVEVDLVFEQDDIKIVTDHKSLLYLAGMEIDFETGLMGRGFKFKNPNAKNSCGCGESFSV
jgi:iron-sulfur cluster assembly protein